METRLLVVRTRRHASQLRRTPRRRVAVNLRRAEPEEVAQIPIDHFDGLNAFEDLPHDGPCVADYWFYRPGGSECSLGLGSSQARRRPGSGVGPHGRDRANPIRRCPRETFTIQSRHDLAMVIIKQPENPETDSRVKAVFDDVRATRKTDFVNNFWRTLAFDPALLENTWSEVKKLMASPTHLDPLTKEMIYVAVSIANACTYCVHSHTAAARARGMTDAQHGELLAIVALAAKTNHLANGLQVPVDDVFDADASSRQGAAV
jgi:AhpD family alkylhydroperoxidase